MMGSEAKITTTSLKQWRHSEPFWFISGLNLTLTHPLPLTTRTWLGLTISPCGQMRLSASAQIVQGTTGIQLCPQTAKLRIWKGITGFGGISSRSFFTVVCLQGRFRITSTTVRAKSEVSRNCATSWRNFAKTRTARLSSGVYSVVR